MSNIVAVEKVEIDALNAPTQPFSFRGGFPIINFEIASQNKFLVGSSVRLNADIAIKQTGTGLLVNNGDNSTGGARARADGCFNCRIGANACIKQITISNQDNQSLEVVREYPRYLASVLPTTHSAADLDTGVAQQSITASRSLVSAQSQNEGFSVSMPLRCGLLSGGNPLPLGMNGLRGLHIQLELSPDAQALSGWYDNNTTLTAVTNPVSYELRNVTLSYDLLVPDEDGQAQMGNATSGELTYNSVNHTYSVLNSSDQVVSLNLAARKVLAVHHNFLPTTFINNQARDGNATSYLRNAGAGAYTAIADLTEVAFTRGGINFPRENPIRDRTVETGDRPQTEVLTTFINSIKPYENMNHSLMSLTTQSGLDTRPQLIDSVDVLPATLPDKVEVYGLGVRTDSFKVGIDYSRTNYGLRVKSTLDGNSPMSLYTFTLAENVLAYSPQGIQVIN